MFLDIIAALVLAIGVCADCFAVSICSCVTVKSLIFRRTAPIALAFALVQTTLLLLGWGLGDLFLGVVEHVAHFIGFGLLAYVGGSMIIEALKGEESVHSLSGLRNVVIAAVATSIDALAIGVSLNMGGIQFRAMVLKAAAVFAVTFASVVVGMLCGSRLGNRFGSRAELAGGIVLLLIGLSMLF